MLMEIIYDFIETWKVYADFNENKTSSQKPEWCLLTRNNKKMYFSSVSILPKKRMFSFYGFKLPNLKKQLFAELISLVMEDGKLISVWFCTRTCDIY